MNDAVYLDHNATAPLRPEAAEAVAEAMRLPGNAASVHGFGRCARARIEAAREQVAGLAGVAPEQVVFTSGGTEANHLALCGCGRPRVLAGATEHPSVLKAAFDVETVPVDAEGVIDLAALDRMLGAGDAPAVVSVMAANNETGVVQPVEEAARLARRHGALFHCDAVQAAGKLALESIVAAGHMMTISAHKLGGPPGVGALVLAAEVPLTARQRGGGQERGLRAGTENLPGIAGFGVAAELAGRDLARFADLAVLRDDLEARLKAAEPALRVAGSGAGRLANTSCLVTPGWPGATQVMGLDLAGVAVSAGSACSSGKVAPSPVLAAMGLDADAAASAIRVSLGRSTTAADVERFIDAWCGLRARAGTNSQASAA